MGLYVDGPSTPSQKIASGGANQTLSGTFDAGSAPNGTFTVTLKGEITGNRYATSTFKLRRPAEVPGGVNASRQGTGKVLVTWSRGSEPDLQSYEVSNTQSGVVGRLSADSACAGSSCKAVLAVPSKAVGQRVGFSVKAFRGDGDGGSVGSGDSAAAYVTFPAPPAAQPTKKAADSAQTPKNRDAQGVDPLPTLPAKKPQAVPSAKPTTKPTSRPRKPTTTKLPDIPDTDPSGNLPLPTADEQGQNDGLVPADAKDGADEAPVRSDAVQAQSSESSIGNIGQYGLYVAGGILLLLIGAHAGAWARRRALAAGTGGGGPAPTVSADTGTHSAAVAQVPSTHAGPQVRQEDGSTSPATAAATRRPAVILAVAKTRVPEQPSRPSQAPGTGIERPLGVRDQQLSREVGSSPDGRSRRPGEGGLGLPPRVAADEESSSRGGVAGEESSPRCAARGQESSPRCAARGQESPPHAAAGVPPYGAGVPPYGAAPGRQELPEFGRAPELDRAGGQVSAPGRVRGETPAPGRVREEMPAPGRVRGEMPAPGQGREVASASGRVHGEVAGGTLQDCGAAGDELGGARGRQEERKGQQGPLHIALPSSAVTDVPEPAVPTVVPAVRLEERWDDYLPPSPRSMEDSGFWERPQPGADDFWAADQEGERSGNGKGDEWIYSGRRHRGGES
ncbi:hypothetical protein [Nonomuraea gerenzanensis]|nr:hypothetical protein [Nonomuraea gerenzanensis]UBU13812.1 hypothetical protein LCN96_01890 [Nonomuraea gerenzanensis]